MRCAAAVGVAGNAAPLHAGEIVRIRDEQWRVVRRVTYDRTTVIDAAGCDTENRTSHGTFLLPFETVERFESHAVPRVVSRRRWRRAARRALAEASPSWVSLRALVHADLRILPFQLEPVLALVRGDGCRFLIADAVGLGKTVQAGLMIAETLVRRPDARALVVAPAALREQWRQELENRFHLGADLLDAAGIARLTSQLPAGVNPWSVRPVAITSIDYVKRPEVMRSLETLTWDVVVFDEAHNLTGRSDRSTAAGAIGNRARVLVLLTATPHSGDDQAFDRLCNVGHLDRTGPLLVFKRTRTDIGLPHARRDTLLPIRPTTAEAAMHGALLAYAKLVWTRSNNAAGAGAQLAMSVLTRRACSSAASLVRSVERRLELLGQAVSASDAQAGLPFMDTAVDDDEPGMSLRAPGLPDALEERGLLLRLLGLARLAAAVESKFTALRRLITRAGEPAIVFTEYRDTLRELPAILADQETVQLHGGLTARERNDVLGRFTDGTARVLLATDAASEGLNLHHRCRLVINLELPWTPLRLEQRAGRVDRIGQSRKVHVVQFVAKGTCEEATLVQLARRIARMHRAMGLTDAIPNERRVAESILGDQPIPDVETVVHGGAAGLLTLDLRHQADKEAERIAGARALLDPNPHVPAESRGVMVRLHHRRALATRQRLWVFRITVSTTSGQVIWDTLVALAADPSAASGRLRRDIRRRLAPDHPSISQALHVAKDQVLRDIRETLRRPVAVWTGRERELAAHLRDCHARLTVGLVQRSLFDHRHERVAASQSALLAEALSQSACRLRELDALNAVEIESCRLVFAALVE